MSEPLNAVRNLTQQALGNRIGQRRVGLIIPNEFAAL
jgi:hypothetical protein